MILKEPLIEALDKVVKNKEKQQKKPKPKTKIETIKNTAKITKIVKEPNEEITKSKLPRPYGRGL